MTETYEPVFWDIETISLDPMEPAPWEDDQPPAIIAIGYGVFKDGWRKCNEWEQAEVMAEVSCLETVDGGTQRWDLFSHEHMLIDSIFGRGGRISEFVNYIEDRGHNAFVTGWNTRNFDHPFVGARASRHRLDPFPVGHERRRLDMMRHAATDYGNSFAVSQDNYLEHLGLPNGDDFTGKDMLNAFSKGDMEAVKSHCKSDIYQMMEIFFIKRELMYRKFYEHYEINQDPVFGDTVVF